MTVKKYFLILAVIGLLLYLPSLFGPFLWDDEDFVFANKYVENFQLDKFFTESQIAGRGKLSNYFRPVPQIAYATTHAVFGFNPFWFHLINVLVHIAATCAIFYFFTLILNGWQRDGFLMSESQREHRLYSSVDEDNKGGQADRTQILIPFIISLLFLIHPVQTEAVSYISGLSDPLFVLFGFLSLIYFSERSKGKEDTPSVSSWEIHFSRHRLLTSLLFFLLSLLSKETGIVFLGLIVLLELTKQKYHDRYKIVWSIFNALKNTWPYILTATGYLWYHSIFISRFDIHAAWGNTLYANFVVVRLLTFVQNLYTYFGLLIFPKDLFMERDYTIPIQTSFFHWSFVLSLILFPFIPYLIRKSKILVFCFLAFFISFIPYSGIVLINGIFYEHFLYLPLVFFFAFIILSVVKGPHTFTRRRLVKVILIVWFISLMSRNLIRQLDWVDPVRFYSQTLSHAPQSVRVRNSLAMAYADRGELDNAIHEYSHAIGVNPKVPNLYHNLANAYAAQGKLDLAEENYLKAINIDPNFIYSWQSLANLYQQTDQKDKLQRLVEQFSTIQKRQN